MIRPHAEYDEHWTECALSTLSIRSGFKRSGRSVPDCRTNSKRQAPISIMIPDFDPKSGYVDDPMKLEMCRLQV